MTKRTTGAAQAGQWVSLPIPTDEGPLDANQRAVMRLSDGDAARVRVYGPVGIETVVTVDTAHGIAFRDKRGEPVDATAVLVAPKRRGGPTQTEAARAARGMVQLKLRIGAQARERLEELCDNSGFSLSEQVEALIDCSWIEWKEAIGRHKKRQARKRK